MKTFWGLRSCVWRWQTQAINIHGWWERERARMKASSTWLPVIKVKREGKRRKESKHSPYAWFSGCAGPWGLSKPGWNKTRWSFQQTVPVVLPCFPSIAINHREHKILLRRTSDIFVKRPRSSGWCCGVWWRPECELHWAIQRVPCGSCDSSLIPWWHTIAHHWSALPCRLFHSCPCRSKSASWNLIRNRLATTHVHTNTHKFTYTHTKRARKHVVNIEHLWNVISALVYRDV